MWLLVGVFTACMGMFCLGMLCMSLLVISREADAMEFSDFDDM